MSASEEPKTIKTKIATQCAKCRRVVWTTDVNADGVCVLCAPCAEADFQDLGKGVGATIHGSEVVTPRGRKRRS